MKQAMWILALIAVAIGAFLIGRSTGAAGERPASSSAPPSPAPAGIDHLAPHAGAHPTKPGGAEPGTSAAPERSGAAPTPGTSIHTDAVIAGPSSSPSSLAACSEQLRILRETIATTEANDVAAHGSPAAPPAGGAEPRFAQAALTNAAATAFKQAKIRGGVEGIDCSEYPCIVHGRINGTEDDVEPLEQARAFDAYDDDISTILLWVRTDEAAEEAAERRGVRDERAEQALFAIAFYSHADAGERGDELDRRIRWRVSEIWTTASPRDETGARPE